MEISCRGPWIGQIPYASSLAHSSTGLEYYIYPNATGVQRKGTLLGGVLLEICGAAKRELIRAVQSR